MTLIYFVFVLGVIVLIHELGHFLFAKKAGIYVYEFSLGMGPRLFKFKRKNDETEYSIRLFPIGGFVQMAGESVQEDEKIPKDKMIQSKTWLQRFMTMIAGVLFNFILAIVLLFIVGLVNGTSNPRPIIGPLDSTLPAYHSGLKEGDMVTRINGKKVHTSDMFLLQMQISLGKTLQLEVVTDSGEKKTVSLEPVEVEENGEKGYKYGFSLKNERRTGVVASIQYAFQKTYSILEQMAYIIAYLITGKLSFNNLSGPVGIYTLVGETAKAGFMNILYLMAYISVNVGFVNLIPLPAFDGGRVLFLIIEKIKGSPISSKTENVIHSVGFILLMILMICITCNDVMRLFG